MNRIVVRQGLITDDYLDVWIESFLKDRKTQGFAPGTLHFYVAKLQKFSQYCDSRMITRIGQLDPGTLKDYFLYLEDAGHNRGGIHDLYRALKTFLLWYWEEVEPGYRNPITRVKIKTPKNEPLEPVSEATVRALLSTCKNDFFSLRDRAIFLVLLDTGVRAAELLAMNIDNYVPTEGRIMIPHGKGDKYRSIFVQQRTRKSLARYIKVRNDNESPLWFSRNEGRLTYWGLVDMIDRRSKKANILPPTLHSFRRAFAINSLRSGMSIYHLQHLMGHADIQVLQRYLKLVDDDLRTAHRQASVVEKWAL